MATWRLTAGLLCMLSIPFRTSPIASAVAEPTVRKELSSPAASASHAVPDYITRYAPLVWLHSEDPFRPADLLEHIRHATPMVDQEPINGLPELDLDNLAMLNAIGDGQVALTSKDNITELPDWLFGETPDPSGKIHNSTPCVVILVEKSYRDVDAFFFYFFSYDQGPNITQVLEPLNNVIEDTEHGMHFGNHVGDWEHNMIRFHDGNPTGIYFSQHVDGAAYPWHDEALSMQDGRPLVYSAYGSHANYPSPGDHIHDVALVDFCDAGKIWDPVLSAYFYHLEPNSFTLTRLFPSGTEPATVLPNLTSFFYFNGIWGDSQYPTDDFRQKTIPYFNLKRFVSGPTGPAAKQLIRKGLFPDHRSTKSWMQWGVGVFMSLYPCCIRGWRVWLYGVVAITLILVTTFAFRYCLKRYRLKGYTRVSTDVPMVELLHYQGEEYSPV